MSTTTHDESDRVDLTVCTDCALVYGAGYTDGDLHQQTYGAIALPWNDYCSHVELWEAVSTFILESTERVDVGVFDCGLCDAPYYGSAYRGHAYARP